METPISKYLSEVLEMVVLVFCRSASCCLLPRIRGWLFYFLVLFVCLFVYLFVYLFVCCSFYCCRFMWLILFSLPIHKIVVKLLMASPFSALTILMASHSYVSKMLMMNGLKVDALYY